MNLTVIANIFRSALIPSGLKSVSCPIMAVGRVIPGLILFLSFYLFSTNTKLRVTLNQSMTLKDITDNRSSIQSGISVQKSTLCLGKYAVAILNSRLTLEEECI